MTNDHRASNAISCPILCLDGGGAKGFYTLGVLTELEAMVGGPLCQRFRLVFGTSTGAIIAALIGLGRRVSEIHNLYKAHVPRIMGCRTASSRSKALTALAEGVFGTDTFECMMTGVGLVATRWDEERPMIFKTSVEQAHGLASTFKPGFGCRVADAVRASCSAYPYFQRPILETSKGRVELLDGGFCANNPTLYAIADAVTALGFADEDLRVLSVGVGVYPEPKPSLRQALIKRITLGSLVLKTLNVNTLSMEQLTRILFKRVQIVRINETFNRPEMATDFLEQDMDKLAMLFQQGGESFAKQESSVRSLLLGAPAGPQLSAI
jgi:uncharacterized protein